MPTRAEKKQQDQTKILEFLEPGPQAIADIAAHISLQVRATREKLNSLIDDGKVERVQPPGSYALCEVPEPLPEPAVLTHVREDIDNQETINRMLNCYDLVLDDIAGTLKTELASKASIEEKIDLIKSLRWVGATIDQLMKRWYLVHRGYDTNTRQAQEDAKQKTVEREKADQKNAPPEDRVVEVGHFHPDMQELWDILPEPEKKKRTV